MLRLVQMLGLARSEASDLGLQCSPMSHKKDVRLINGLI